MKHQTINDLSELSREAIDDFKKVAGGEPIPSDVLVKAGITQATGLVSYDLQAPSKNLFPVLTPLRNKIPRVGAAGGTATNWKAVTAVNTAKLQPFVPEGVRQGVLTTAVSDKSAAYRSYGLEDNVTFEADLAAKNLEDVRATTAQRLLWATMIQEELAILGANGTNGVALGTPANLALVPVVSGGAILDDAGGYKVRVVALTLFGKEASAVTLAGVPQVVSVTSADGTVFTYNGGSSLPSAEVTSAAVAGTVADTSSIKMSCDAIPGAVAYAWYAAAHDAAGGPILQGITTINSFLWTTPKAGTQAVSAITADCSKSSISFEGILAQAYASGSGAYIKTMATGTPGVGTPLTASGRGTITEIDTMIQYMYDNYKIVPDEIFVSAQEINNMGSKMFGGTVNGNLRYTVNVDGGGDNGNQLIAGISSILYPNLLGLGRKTIPITVHPNMPSGTLVAPTYSLPYPINGVPNVMEMKMRRDYYQIEWPQRTRKYESGVYADGALVHYFPPSVGIIHNIANG
jgi:hypothetical protein